MNWHICQEIKKEGKINFTWIRKRKVFIRTMETPKVAKKYCIKSKADYNLSILINYYIMKLLNE